MEATDNLTIQFNLLLNQVNGLIHKLFIQGIGQENIIISIPEHLINYLQEEMLATQSKALKIEDMRLSGCKVQYAYENKITVFNKSRHLNKSEYYQIELL